MKRQREVSVSHDRLGDVAVAQGDLIGAQAAYAAGLAIVARLAAQDAGNAGWQRDLFVSDLAQVRRDIARLRGA